MWELEKMMPLRPSPCSLAASHPVWCSILFQFRSMTMIPFFLLFLIAIHSTIHLLKLGSPPPHKEARQRRKELRRKLLAEQEELERQMKELQAANENKQQELESVRKVGAGQQGNTSVPGPHPASGSWLHAR